MSGFGGGGRDLTLATADVAAPEPERLRASVLADQALEVARATAIGPMNMTWDSSIIATSAGRSRRARSPTRTWAGIVRSISRDNADMAETSKDITCNAPSRHRPLRVRGPSEGSRTSSTAVRRQSVTCRAPRPMQTR
jgi:hypothetical protein